MRITVNNNDYLLQWGMGAILQYCDDMDCDLEGLDWVMSNSVQGQKALLCLVMAAIKNGCKFEGKTCDINESHLMAAVDEMPQEQWDGILNDFVDSKYQGKTIRERLYGAIPAAEEPEKGKKKTTRSKPQK